jgi:hypothetical protein
MTGFGSAGGQWEQWTLRAEVRSVNHRELQVTFRLPEAFQLGADVALVGLLGVVGVLVTAPVVHIVEILRHVPLAQGGDERVETLNPHLRGGSALPARRGR